MEKRNIYKMDDVLITASFFMLIPAAYLSWPWLRNLPEASDLTGFLFSAPEVLGARLTMIYLYLGGAVLAQAGGRIIRAKEKQALDVLDTLLFMRNANLPSLSIQLGLSQDKIRKLVTRLSRIRSLSITMTGDEITMGPTPASGYSAGTAGSSSAFGSPVAAPAKAVESFTAETKAAGAIPDNVRAELEARLKDGSLSFSEKIAIMGKIAQAAQKGGLDEVSLEGSVTENSDTGESRTKKKGLPLLLIIILFMTPLWPIALILIFTNVYKQHKGNKEES